MSVLEKAKVLADAIAECEELKAVRDAEIAMSQDDEAQNIISDFQAKQQEFHQVMMAGEELTPEQEKQRDDIEARMQGNESIRNYLDAQQKFESLLKAVNFAITRGITGSEDDCSSGCSSCGSGCC